MTSAAWWAVAVPRMAGPCTFHSQQLQADPGGALFFFVRAFPSVARLFLDRGQRACAQSGQILPSRSTNNRSLGGRDGPAGEESTPCTKSTTAQNYRLSLELSRPGFNKQERERGAPSGRQRALWRTSRANQPTVRAFATFRLSNNICSLLMWRSAGV